MATEVSGKVIKMTANREGTVIGLDNNPATGPKDNVWALMRDHGNYNALHSLAMSAAVNRWPVTIRIEGDAEVDPQVPAAAEYIRVEWQTQPTP